MLSRSINESRYKKCKSDIRLQHLACTKSLFKEVTDSVEFIITQKEQDFIDFNIQKLLPHKFSEYGPALAAGDINGNGLDDIFIGGSFLYDTQYFYNKKWKVYKKESYSSN